MLFISLKVRYIGTDYQMNDITNEFGCLINEWMNKGATTVVCKLRGY